MPVNHAQAGQLIDLITKNNNEEKEDKKKPKKNPPLNLACLTSIWVPWDDKINHLRANDLIMGQVIDQLCGSPGSGLVLSTMLTFGVHF